MSLRGQLLRLFVEPEVAELGPAGGTEPGEGARWLPPAPSGSPGTAADSPPGAAPAFVGVVCAARDGRVAGGAVGLAMAHRVARRGCVLAEWPAPGAPASARDGAGAAPAARRLAAELRSAGFAAGAHGRLARVGLAPGEPGAAELAALRRTIAAPVALVVAGPRSPAADWALAQAEVVVLAHRADVDAAMLELAVAELAALGPRVAMAAIGPSPGAAALARSGTALVAPLRSPFAAAVGG